MLTPNGFGVVNTSNLARASKLRVDRLIGSMLAHHDDCIAALLSGSFNSRRLADIVNYIRLNAESFEECTAKLFLAPQATGRLAPLIFRNEKKASGYFF